MRVVVLVCGVVVVGVDRSVSVRMRVRVASRVRMFVLMVGVAVAVRVRVRHAVSMGVLMEMLVFHRAIVRAGPRRLRHG